jgi:hypothetical protein
MSKTAGVSFLLKKLNFPPRRSERRWYFNTLHPVVSGEGFSFYNPFPIFSNSFENGGDFFGRN